MSFRDLGRDETRRRLTAFLEQELAGPTSASSLAHSLMNKFAIVEDGQVEFHTNGGEWTGVYLYGNLVDAGDHYHATDWLESVVGVRNVSDSDFLIDNRHAYPTTAAIAEARRKAAEAEVERLEAARGEALARATAELDAQIAAAKAAATQ